VRSVIASRRVIVPRAIPVSSCNRRSAIFVRPSFHDRDWLLPRSPCNFESSAPGVFAVGDVRSANVKRVASAVGEGSICVQFVHQLLAEH